MNVNYRYVVEETRYLLSDSGARTLVHAPEFGDVAARRGRRTCRYRPARDRRGVRDRDLDVVARRSVDGARTGRRRPHLPLHGWNHRPAQGRHVAQRRPVRRAVADVAPGHRASRPGRRGPCGQAGRHRPARVPADARHRLCSSRCRPWPAAARSSSSTGPASTPSWSGTRSSATASSCSPSSATCSPARSSPRSTQHPDRWRFPRLRAITLARASRGARRSKRGLLAPPPAGHPPRLARRVRGDDVAAARRPRATTSSRRASPSTSGCGCSTRSPAAR